MNPAGVLSVQSTYSVHETTNRLENILRKGVAMVYVRIDQQAELKKAGWLLSPWNFFCSVTRLLEARPLFKTLWLHLIFL
jgi:hypothetical protein